MTRDIPFAAATRSAVLAVAVGLSAVAVATPALAQRSPAQGARQIEWPPKASGKPRGGCARQGFCRDTRALGDFGPKKIVCEVRMVCPPPPVR
jgi:hypothetical protein